MRTPNILIQMDCDDQASVFDAVVAVDSGVDHLLQHHGVTARDVQNLVHGAIFTRAPEELRRTAIFVGGSNVADGEALLKQVTDCFFGPLRVSVMMDANGANTTAAAAVLAAARHVDLSQTTALVMAATGPVGQRAARLLAAEGATVRAGSRSLQRAGSVCDAIRERVPQGSLEPIATSDAQQISAAVDGVQVVVAAGAAGVTLLGADAFRAASALQVAIDLNAVPPLGIEGIEVADKAVERSGVICYGAIGVGGTKMKIHKAAIQRLFSANDLVLDAEQVYELGRDLEPGRS
jgi:hypothetical protein